MTGGAPGAPGAPPTDLVAALTPAGHDQLRAVADRPWPARLFRLCSHDPCPVHAGYLDRVVR